MDFQQAVVTRQSGTVSNYVAPISGGNLGIKRAEIKQGVREVILCKGSDGKVGVRFQAISKVRIIVKHFIVIYELLIFMKVNLLPQYICHFGVNFLSDVMEFKDRFTEDSHYFRFV